MVSSVYRLRARRSSASQNSCTCLFLSAGYLLGDVTTWHILKSKCLPLECVVRTCCKTYDIWG